MNSFRAVIFDLDGVLADSEPTWDEIDAQLLAEHGVKYRGEYHKEVLGVSYRSSVEFFKKTFGISAPTEEMMRRRGEIATEFFANRIGLFPHVKEVLEKLREIRPSGSPSDELPVVSSGRSASPREERIEVRIELTPQEDRLRLAIATSSVSASARPFLDRHQLTKYFDVIISGDEIERGKPAPDIYLRSAEKLDVSPNACLVIEDSLSGIAAAKAAKMRVAAIPDRRFVNPHDYEKEADYLLANLSEILPLVRQFTHPRATASNPDAAGDA